MTARARCSHRPPCPGCPRFGAAVPAPKRLAELEAFCERHGAPSPHVFRGEPMAHRHRARLAVRGRANSPKIGIFQEGSHRIADIPNCPIHREEINRAAAAIRRAVRSSGVSPYAEGPHAGLLRYVQLLHARESHRVQVSFVVNARDAAKADRLVAATRREMGETLDGLWLNLHEQRGNTILGKHWYHVGGESHVIETVAGAPVHFHPGSFGQANLDLADRLVDHIHAILPTDVSVNELYCGCGAIGLGLAARGQRIAFNELSPFGLEGLGRGLSQLGITAPVIAGPAETAFNEMPGADVVIVDPPRKGLGESLTRALTKSTAEIVAVYCGFEAFLEEVGFMISEGRRLVRADAFDLFPFTDHLEVVARIA